MDIHLQNFREQIDDFMQFHPQSPLEEAQRDGFRGLRYYDENPALVLVVAVERLPDDEPLIEMETSTGDAQLFRRWGAFDFDVDGEPARLTIYSDASGVEFFLPFRDATSGEETYGAGRYLDNHRPGLQRLNEEEFEVDFNYEPIRKLPYQARYGHKRIEGVLTNCPLSCTSAHEGCGVWPARRRCVRRPSVGLDSGVLRGWDILAPTVHCVDGDA